MKSRNIGNQWMNNSNIDAVDAIRIASTRPSIKENEEYLNPNSITWHIPRPSLIGRNERDSDNSTSSIRYHMHHNSSTSSCKSSEGSSASIHSAASRTLLLTAANLANFTAFQHPIIKATDTASIASSTHFTVINGLERSNTVSKKSCCARNQLTFLVCTMSILFMIGLLIVIFLMDLRVRDKYN